MIPAAHRFGMPHLELPEGVPVWFSSDHHFNHKNIIRFSERPYAGLWHMNTDMIRRHNAVVEPHHTVILTGDLVLGDFDEGLDYASQLNGDIWFKLGNHDRGSAAGRQRPGYAERFREKYEAAGFKVLTDLEETTITIGGRTVVISHYPYRGDHTEHDRHVALRPEDRGLPLIHGHIHQLRKISGRMFNVGVDVNNFTPVSDTEIIAWLETLA